MAEIRPFIMEVKMNVNKKVEILNSFFQVTVLWIMLTVFIILLLSLKVFYG